MLHAIYRSTIQATMLCLTMATVLGYSTGAHAVIATMGEAINIAGRQRMLSQRIAQSYFLIGLNPESERGVTQLQRSVNEFEHNLQDLKNYAPAQGLSREIADVESAWKSYRALATGPITKANGELLLAESNDILAKAHHYVMQLEKVSGTQKAEIINISGRQRMLSQRIAKNFLAAHWHVGNRDVQELLFEDLAEYENVLSYLSESGVNTAEIDTQLVKVKGQFNYAMRGFEGAMSLSGARLIHVVTGTTDAMLRSMNIVTGLYAELLAD